MAPIATAPQTGVLDETRKEQTKAIEGETRSPAELHVLVAVAVIQQGIDLLSSNITLNDQLTYQSKYIPGSTIGKHLRHARDHFAMLFECISDREGQSSSPVTPVILTYDSRKRNTPMESSIEAARAALLETVISLQETVPNVNLDHAINLHAVTPYPQVMQTSFGREVWFSSLHAIHHWSMIRVIMAEQGLQVDDTFGVAPSTLVYRGQEGPLGKARI